jgi:hypothetical protein
VGHEGEALGVEARVVRRGRRAVRHVQVDEAAHEQAALRGRRRARAGRGGRFRPVWSGEGVGAGAAADLAPVVEHQRWLMASGAGANAAMALRACAGSTVGGYARRAARVRAPAFRGARGKGGGGACLVEKAVKGDEDVCPGPVDGRRNLRSNIHSSRSLHTNLPGPLMRCGTLRREEGGAGEGGRAGTAASSSAAASVKAWQAASAAARSALPSDCVVAKHATCNRAGSCSRNMPCGGGCAVSVGCFVLIFCNSKTINS